MSSSEVTPDINWDIPYILHMLQLPSTVFMGKIQVINAMFRLSTAALTF